MMYLRSTLRVGLSLAVVAATSTVAAEVHAAEGPSATAPTAAEEPTVGTIVVTAQKRSENVQHVGIAISAYSESTLKSKGISDVQGLANIEPNIKLFDQVGGGVPILIIRGVGVQDFRVNSTPAASFYFDDVYQSTLVAASYPIYDVQGFELLKGPQGGLYGRNTTAGAVSIVSNKPQLGRFGGSITAGYGSYDTGSGEGYVNVPLGENAAIRMAGFLEKGSGGPWYSTTGHFNSGAPDRIAGRVALRWKPTNALEVNLQFHAGRDDSSLPLPKPVGIWQPSGAAKLTDYANGAYNNYLYANPGASSVCAAFFAGHRDDANCQAVNGLSPAAMGIGPGQDYDSAGPTRNKLKNNWIGGLADIKYQMGELTLQSITAYDRLDYNRTAQWDGIPTPQTLVFYHTGASSFSQELRLLYAHGPLNFIIGASYGHDTLKDSDYLVSYEGLIPYFYGSTAAYQAYSQPTTSKAIYGHVEYSVTPQIKLIGEARYTDEQKRNDESTVILSAPPYGPVAPVVLYPAFPAISARLTAHMPTGKISLNYAPSQSLMLYASISRGEKSGGFFGGFASDASQTLPYRPETVVAYEAGFKSDWLDRTLRFNGSVFYYDDNDFQASATHSSPSGAIQGLTNVGRVHDYGVELQVQWVPTRNWRFDASIGTANAKIVSSPYLTGDAFGASNAGALHPLQGANIPNYSKFSGHVGGAYSWDLPGGYKADLGLDYDYKSSQDLALIVYAPEAAVYREPGYGLMGLQASLTAPDARWKVFGFIKNLTDQRYRTTAAIDGLGGLFEIYGLPRTWGARAQMSF